MKTNAQFSNLSRLGLAAALVLFFNLTAQAQSTWANTGADWNTAGNWTPTGVPSANTAIFSGVEVSNPNLSASDSISELEFSTTTASGYTLSDTNSSVLTLTSTGTTTTTSAISALNTSGTNTISSNLDFSGASGTSTQEISQANGGTLNITGTVTALGAGGTLELSSGVASGTSTGGISINGLTLQGAGVSLGTLVNLQGSNSVGAITTTANSYIMIGSGSTLTTGGINSSTAVTDRILGLGTLIITGSTNNNIDIGRNNTFYAPTIIISNANALGASTANTLLFAGDSAATIESASATGYTIPATLKLSDVDNATATFGTASTGNLTFTGPASLGTFIFTIMSGNTTTFSGSIGAGSGGSVDVGGPGEVVFSGANTYTGATTILGGGTLSVATLGNVASHPASNLGSPTTAANGTIAIGSTTTAGTLVDTGTGETTDRVINLAGTTGGATIDQSGTGALKFTSNFTATGAGIKTLTLQGSTAGTGEIAGVIVDNSGTNKTSLTKQGTGTWTLSGANTYTGATTILGGTLSVATLGNVASHPASNLGSPTTAANGTIAIGSTTTAGTLVDTGTGETTDRVINLAGTTGGATIDQSGTGALKFTSNFTATGAGIKTLTLQGSTAGTGEIVGNIVDNSGTNKTSLTKQGTGTWTLSGANTYTGATSVNAGTLSINSVGNTSTAQSLGEGGVLNLGVASSSGGNVIYTGGTGTLSGGTINALGSGSGIVNSITNSGSGTLTLADSIVKSGTTFSVTGAVNIGGVISGSAANSDMDYNGATSTISVAGAYNGPTHIFNTSTVTNGVNDALPDTNGGASANSTLILGDGSESGAQTNIYALGGFTQTLGGLTSTTGSGTDANEVTGGSGTLSTLTLNIASGTDTYLGLLGTGVAGASNANNLALVKSGAGTLALSAGNTYTGATSISAGTLTINTVGNTSIAQSLGDGTVINLGVAGISSGLLNYTGGTGTLSGRTINVLGNGTDTIKNSGAGTLTLQDSVVKTGTTFTVTGLVNIAGVISGNTGSPNSDMDYNGATSTISVAGTYNGPTHIFNTSTVTNGINDALPDTNGGASANTVLTLGDASEVGSKTNTYALGGFTQTLGGLVSTAGSGTDTNSVIGGSATLSTLTVNVTSGTDSYTGFLGTGVAGANNNNNLAMVKNGAGTLGLTQANTYTGATSVNAGTLVVTNTTGSATGSGALSVARGAALAGTGTSSGSSFAIGGTSGSGTASVYVGQTAATGDTNTTNNLTLIGSGASTIANANLTFNLNTSAGGGNELLVGGTAITFGSGTVGDNPVTLTLNLQNNTAVTNIPYFALIAGNAGDGTLASTQYSGLTFGTQFAADGGFLTPILNSSVGGSGNLVLALNVAGYSPGASGFYGGQAGLYLFQTSGGIDDIVVIPEPSAWALMLGGLAVLIFWQRRQRRNSGRF